MSSSIIGITAPPVASTVAPESAAIAMGFVIAWSRLEPHRVGEAGFLRFQERMFFGRGGKEAPEKYVQFSPHRPGGTPRVASRGPHFAESSISGHQLELLWDGDVAIEQVGTCKTLVNGVEIAKRATVRPGDTIMLKGELLLLCVLRPRMLPCPPELRVDHALGEADADGICGEAPPTWDLRARIAMVAATDDNVLIQGASGAGKELTAKAIHEQSPRAHGPFVPHNAATFSPELVESDLFGNIANYPNMGMPARKGLVGAADGGTLFLDEIGELSIDVQAQLLRVMEGGEYRPLGDSTPRRSNFRLIGATNKGDEKLREDLIPRFGHRIHLVPLAERREDIPLILRQFLLARVRKYSALERLFKTTQTGRMEPQMSARLVDYLVRSPLPGNARDLHNIMLEAIEASPGDKLVLAPGMVLTSSLLPTPRVAVGGWRKPGKGEFLATLVQERWNITRVASIYDMSRGAVYRLIEEYELEPEQERAKLELKKPRK